MDRDLILSGRRTIEKEVRALSALVETIDERFAEACELLFRCRGTVVLTGMGKSGLVARKWASTFSSTGTAAYFLNPAEASHGDLGLLRREDALVALSLSGETEELSPVIRHATETGVPLIGVTGDKTSSLARHASVVLPIAPAEEACPLGLAPTSSTTMMMALGDAMAVTLMEMRGFTEKDFARLHPGGTLGRKHWLRVRELMHRGEKIPRVLPHAPFDEVLVEMTQKCLGLAVVMEEGKVAGVITDGDLRRFFQSGHRGHAVARDMMTRSPKMIHPEALAWEAREIMEKSRIQQILVMDEKQQLVGVVHFHDLMRAKVM